MNDNAKSVEVGGQPVVRVVNEHCTGEVHLLGATVTGWQPKGAAPVIWLSDSAVFDGATPIRGGVPICFPWFGKGRSGERTPSHGWARTAEWTFDGATDGDEGTTVTFSLERDGLALTYTITMGKRLELVLSTTNVGREGTEIENALHTYLAVRDIDRVTIDGLDGVEYVDKADNHLMKRQSGPVTFSGETDRVYLSEGDVTVDDGERTLLVQAQGGRNTVVWNPGEEKAAAMADISGDAWRTLVCVEAANAMDSSFLLQPGGTHTLAQRISLQG